MNTNIKNIGMWDIVADGNKSLLEYMDNENVGIVPEDIFLKYFLPMFSGTVPINDNLLSIWYSKVGGPLNYAWIVKNNKKIIKIPPLKDRFLAIPTDINHVGDPNMIFLNHKNMSSISPSVAKLDLINDLTDRYLGSNELVTQTSSLEKEWINVMFFYGIKSKEITEGIKKEDETEELEYD